MARRPAHTLFFIGAHRTDRADFGPSPNFALLGQDHKASQEIDDPAARLEAALASGRRLGKSVWILWEGTTTLMLDMPAAVVDGLEAKELAESLSFEAETLTGLPAVDSAIEGVPQPDATGILPESRRFWITQLPSDVREKIEAVLKQSHGELAGILHPGGLPKSRWDGKESDDGEWRRIEVWDQLTFSLHGNSEGGVDIQVIRFNPGSEGWSGELPNSGPVTWLGPGPVSRVAPDGHRVTFLTAEGLPLEPEKIDFPPSAAPIDWLRAWARELSARPMRVPVVKPGASRYPNQKYYLTGALATSLALGLTIGHASLLINQTNAARQKADTLAQARSQLSAPDNSGAEVAEITAKIGKFQGRLSDLDQQKSDLQNEVDQDEKIIDVMKDRDALEKQLDAIHRPALAQLLGALVESEAHGDPTQLIVNEVRQNSDGALRLTGLCREAALADNFAGTLENRLRDSGWSVGAAQKQQRDDGAFNFAVVLTPKVLLAKNALSSVAEAGGRSGRAEAGD
jgi:hypothetical protein